ncbi:MAG: ABC transporter permease, partial [Gemmatimonadota bacterium]|nr:ABC transporter permease [Gemmatimonadota bacterium]
MRNKRRNPGGEALPRPPRVLEWVVERCLPAGLSRQSALGDLAEGFGRRTGSGSRFRASCWYAAQAASIALHRVLRDPGGSPTGEGSDLGMDVRWSIRSMVRHPGSSLGIVAVLGLGLGANVAVFSVVDGTLGDTSAWTDPDRTVAVWPGTPFSLGQIDLYGREQAAYRSVGGYLELAFALERPDGESESVNGVMITPALFQELARQPALGRGLSEEDGFLGAEPVVVLGHGLWERTFGGDPDVLGTRVDVGGSPRTVIGVQQRGFSGPGGRAELWFPIIPDPRDDDFWKAQNYTTIGVLRDGASLGNAHQDLMAFADLLSDMFPMFYRRDFAKGLAGVAVADAEQRRLISTPLLLLLAGTGLLMIVTALNVGNLLLGRSIERRRELSIRAALGAGRRRIVRQLLVEGLGFSVLAVVVGVLLAVVGGDWIASLFVEQAVVSVSPILSRSVLLYAVVLSALAWVVLNGVPVAHFLRGGRGGLALGHTGRSVGRSTLVTAQAALATLLLVSATLLVVTVGNLRDVPLGFEPEGILTVELSTPQDRVATASEARALYDALARNVEALPGVEGVGLTGWLPMRQPAPPTPINLESDPIDPREASRASMEMVDPGFFSVFGVEPLQGRLLDGTDRADLPGAVVVNQTLASTLWPNGNAIGQRIA